MIVTTLYALQNIHTGSLQSRSRLLFHSINILLLDLLLDHYYYIVVVVVVVADDDSHTLQLDLLPRHVRSCCVSLPFTLDIGKCRYESSSRLDLVLQSMELCLSSDGIPGRPNDDREGGDAGDGDDGDDGYSGEGGILVGLDFDALELEQRCRCIKVSSGSELDVVDSPALR